MPGERLIAHCPHKCLSSTYSVPGTGLTTGNTIANEIDNILYSEGDRQYVSKQIKNWIISWRWLHSMVVSTFALHAEGAEFAPQVEPRNIPQVRQVPPECAG